MPFHTFGSVVSMQCVTTRVLRVESRVHAATMDDVRDSSRIVEPFIITLSTVCMCVYVQCIRHIIHYMNGIYERRAMCVMYDVSAPLEILYWSIVLIFGAYRFLRIANWVILCVCVCARLPTLYIRNECGDSRRRI